MDKTLIFEVFGHFYKGKSTSDTKPVSASRQDLRVWAVSAGRRESKNRKLLFKIYFIFFKIEKFLKVKKLIF
jgi:hypothetical protein